MSLKTPDTAPIKTIYGLEKYKIIWETRIAFAEAGLSMYKTVLWDSVRQKSFAISHTTDGGASIIFDLHGEVQNHIRLKAQQSNSYINLLRNKIKDMGQFDPSI